MSGNLNPQHPNTLSNMIQVLENTMSTIREDRQAAERQLMTLQESVAHQLGFIQVLFTVMDNATLSDGVRMAAGVALKNTVKNTWDAAQADSPLQEMDKEFLRTNVFDALLRAPKFLRNMLFEVISLVAAIDFPRAWPTCLTSIIERLRMGQDFKVLECMSNAAHSVLLRYRKFVGLTLETKEELLSINAVFTVPLLELMQKCVRQLKASPATFPIDEVIRTLHSACEVFYDVTYLDMGEEHAHNLQDFMQCLLEGLTYQNAELQNQGGEDSPMVQLKATVLQCIILHIQKYDEDFEPYVRTFMSEVWNLFSNVAKQPDELVISAMDFVAEACKGIHAFLVNDPNVLKSLCENVVLPNIRLQDEDEEMFTDEPHDYVLRDIEGSDAHTRRRSACELVRGLMVHHEHRVGPIFQQYVQELLQQQDWRSKDCAIHLVVALAVKTRSAAQSGIQQLQTLVPVGEFFSSEILPELQDFKIAPPRTHPIVKADAIRFVATFRQQIPAQQYAPLLNILGRWIESDSMVVHTYAAHTVERMLMVKDNDMPRVTPELLQPMAASFLATLCNRLAKEKIPNEYTMKCLWRLVKVSPTITKPFVGDIVMALNAVISEAAKNPSNPTYNHFMFECVSTCILSAPELGMAIEGALWDVLIAILSNDVLEFLPYSLQILAQLIDTRPSGQQMPQQYMSLFPPLLSPTIYEQKGNIPAVTRLVCSFLRKYPTQVDEAGFTEKVLGVFQMLLSSKQYDHEGFNLLVSLLSNFEKSKLEPYIKTVYELVFQRLTRAKTHKLMKCVSLFVCVHVVIGGAETVTQLLNSFQQGLLEMLLTNVVFATAAVIPGIMERKHVAVALTDLICDSTLVQRNQQLWKNAVAVVITVLYLHPEMQGGGQQRQQLHGGTHTEDSEEKEDGGFSNIYHALQGASLPPQDLCPQVQDAKMNFHSKLNAFLSSSPAHKQLVQGLPQELTQYL